MLAWSRLKKRWLERQLLNRRTKNVSGRMYGDDFGGCGCVKGDTASISISLRSVLRAMTLSELKSLWAAVRSGGGKISDCIMVPKSLLDATPKNDDSKSPGALKAWTLCYEAFVMPLETDDLDCVVPLSWCRLADQNDDESFADQTTVCCNPYHYGMVAPDIASSSSGAIDDRDEGGQSRASFSQSDAIPHDNVEKRDGEDSGNGDTGFFSDTSGTHVSQVFDEYGDLPQTSAVGNRVPRYSSDDQAKPWCYVAYWEENCRQGPLVAVVDSTSLVYFDAPKPPSSIIRSSLRLASLNRSDCSDAIRKTRVKIGLGIALFRRKGSVWLYNRSQNCIFVRSNTCFRNRARPLRLKPGCCCRVHQVGLTVPRVGGGPEESPTALISFVKGWGRSYVRPFVTCCPCWVQVIFAS